MPESLAKYILRSIADVIKDYGDVALAAASALALTDKGNNLFGEYRIHVVYLGAGLSAIVGGLRDNGWSFRDNPQSKGFSFTRNFYAGLSTSLIRIDNMETGPIDIEIGMKIIEALAIAGFVSMEHARRKEFRETHKTATMLEDSL